MNHVTNLSLYVSGKFSGIVGGLADELVGLIRNDLRSLEELLGQLRASGSVELPADPLVGITTFDTVGPYPPELIRRINQQAIAETCDFFIDRLETRRQGIVRILPALQGDTRRCLMFERDERSVNCMLCLRFLESITAYLDGVSVELRQYRSEEGDACLRTLRELTSSASAWNGSEEQRFLGGLEIPFVTGGIEALEELKDGLSELSDRYLRARDLQERYLDARCNFHNRFSGRLSVAGNNVGTADSQEYLDSVIECEGLRCSLHRATLELGATEGLCARLYLNSAEYCRGRTCLWLRNSMVRVVIEMAKVNVLCVHINQTENILLRLESTDEAFACADRNARIV